MIFTYLSAHVDPNSSSRIGAQLVAVAGFPGAGIILKSEAKEKITNLTTGHLYGFQPAIVDNLVRFLHAEAHVT